MSLMGLMMVILVLYQAHVPWYGWVALIASHIRE
jgi:hypothetical protein